MAAIIVRWLEYIKESINNSSIYYLYNNVHPSVYIFDDVYGTQNKFIINLFNETFIRGRYKFLSCFVPFQSFNKLTPQFTENATTCFTIHHISIVKIYEGKLKTNYR